MTWVLVVDDDEAIRETITLALEDAGHSVTQAGDGAAALEALRASAWPYVVLLDALMPVLDGASTLRVAQADATLVTRHAFILMTASPKSFLGENAPHAPLLASLSVAVMSKPFDIEALLRAVDDAARRLPAN